MIQPVGRLPAQEDIRGRSRGRRRSNSPKDYNTESMRRFRERSQNRPIMSWQDPKKAAWVNSSSRASSADSSNRSRSPSTVCSDDSARKSKIDV